MNTLFHKQTRNFRKRQPWKRRRKIEVTNLTESLEKLLDNYKSCHFCFSIRSLILTLPRKCMITLWSIVNNWVTTHDVPDRIVVLVKDLIAFRKRTTPIVSDDVVKGSKKVGSFMTVRYHYKGIEMLELPKILHRSVMNTIPQFLSNKKPPRVSYSYSYYTKTIASRVFNQKKVVEKLDFDSGTEDMQCDCSTCKYCYEPAGHVVTGDLSIIRDAALRAQNSINLKINEDICRRAVAEYTVLQAKTAKYAN